MQAVVFQQPVEKTQKAAIDAVVVLGFKVKKSEPLYVEGFMPRKASWLFPSFPSGGETVGVWLEVVETNRTRVRVNTAKSLYGQPWQKDWDDKILGLMEKFLGEKEE